MLPRAALYCFALNCVAACLAITGADSAIPALPKRHLIHILMEGHIMVGLQGKQN